MDLSRLDGKVAVITGSSQGIGLAAARRLAQLGARVVVNSRSEERAEQTAKALVSEGLKAVGAGADVATDAGVSKLFERALRACGTIDILVNNAGTTVVKPSEDLSREEWEHVISVNLTGPFLCAQAAGRIMLAKGEGVSVNPGYAATALVEQAMRAGKFSPEDLARRSPVGRIATLEEIANAIAFLASPAASYINATTLLIDGGWTAYGGWS